MLTHVTTGTRYAYLAVKIFMVKFFQSYRVIPSEKTNMGVAEVRESIFINNYKLYNLLFSWTHMACLPSKVEPG